jgi:hypothetical protein
MKLGVVMFEKISKLIEGAATVKEAEPLLAAAGLVTELSSSRVLHVLHHGESFSIIELWGNKMILRGLDSNGVPQELVAHPGN